MNAPPSQVMVFVDAGYVFGVMKNFHQVKALDDLAIAAQGLIDLIRDRVEDQVGPVLRIRWYDATDPTRRITNPRAVAMGQLAGVRLVEGRIVARPGRMEQKAVDTRLVVDMLTIAFQRQVPGFVLISGDEDMAPGVEAAQDLGIRVEVWSIEGEGLAQSVSRQLLALADGHRTFTVSEMAAVITAKEIRTTQEPLVPAEPAARPVPTPAPPPISAAVTPETEVALPADPSASAPPADPLSVDVPAVTPQPVMPSPALLGRRREPTALQRPASRPPAARQTPVDLTGLYGIDQAGYHEPIAWEGAGTDQQRANRAGAVYAARWWQAADQAARDHLGQLCPGVGQFSPIPGEIDADLLRFAEDHGLDTWGHGWVKIAVRDGFWDEIDSVAPADDDLGPATDLGG